MAASPNDWLFDEDDLQHTPSRVDGVSYEQEMYDRAYGIDLIVRVGSVRINVPLLTVATASVLFHRFYMLKSLRKYPAREVAMACLFLSSKIEESLRKIEAVVNYLLRLEDRRQGKEPNVHPSDPKFKKLVQQVLFLEEVVLVTLQFDMTVQHPHPLLSRALKIHAAALDEAQLTALGRCAWQVLSDIYTTPFCICYEPVTLAAAAFLLAWTNLEASPALPATWSESFADIDWTDREQVEEIDIVAQKILEVWQGARDPELRKNAAQLKERYGMVIKASVMDKPADMAIDEAAASLVEA